MKSKDFFDLSEKEQKKIISKSAKEANEMQKNMKSKITQINIDCHKTCDEDEHKILGHDPLCLWEIGKCDCGKKEEDWEKEFDHNYAHEWYDENANGCLTCETGDPKDCDCQLKDIKQFIRQLLVKKSRRI